MLKKYEAYSYQVAFYLLQNDIDASTAAEQALLALFAQQRFFELPDLQRRCEVKLAAIKHSLEVKKQRLCQQHCLYREDVAR